MWAWLPASLATGLSRGSSMFSVEKNRSIFSAGDPPISTFMDQFFGAQSMLNWGSWGPAPQSHPGDGVWETAWTDLVLSDAVVCAPPPVIQHSVWPLNPEVMLPLGDNGWVLSLGRSDPGVPGVALPLLLIPRTLQDSRQAHQTAATAASGCSGASACPGVWCTLPFPWGCTQCVSLSPGLKQAKKNTPLPALSSYPHHPQNSLVYCGSQFLQHCKSIHFCLFKSFFFLLLNYQMHGFRQVWGNWDDGFCVKCGHCHN